MSELIAFIESRLAEDEAHARKDLWALDRASADWEAHYGVNLPWSELQTSTATYRLEGPAHEEDAFLVSRAVRTLRRRAERVLREVEAKLAILVAHPLANDPDEPAHCETCRYIADPGDPEPFPEAGYPCPSLRALAMVWSEHPDYRAEWGERHA